MSIRVLCNASVLLAWLVVPLPAFAQTTGSLAPGKASGSLTQEEPPPGGCMPIGVTAAGDTVFPYTCKAFIEAHKGKPSPQASERGSVVERAPSVDTAAASVVDAVAAPPVKETNAPPVERKVTVRSDEPATRTEEGAAPKREQRRNPRAAGAPPNCAQFRTFDSVTGMYRDSAGQTRACTAAK